ncbi:MAG: molybdopterin-dependent oxidoreductase, partial [Bilophila sp.]
RNVQQACRSVLGIGRGELNTDYKQARHIVFQGRNPFESLNVPEAGAILDAKAAGCKISVMDIRATVTAARADEFFLMRPGTDYAMNLAILHVIITEELYNPALVARQMADFETLAAFVRPCTPHWAEAQTGIKAERIATLARELAQAAPRIIWYPGWFTARYADSFLVARSAYLINAVLGAIGVSGGLTLGLAPKDVGRKGLNRLATLYPKAPAKAVDKTDWQAPGLLQRAFRAIETDDPYPIRAYLSIRHNVLSALPDPEALRRQLNKLDFMVAITTTWSATAAYADLVLPLSPPLSRESILATKTGARPQFFRRMRAVAPRFKTKADWEILCGLATRMGFDKLAFTRIEDIWDYQLEGTGVVRADFDQTGFVNLSSTPAWKQLDAITLSTPSGKFEARSQLWLKNGQETLVPYVAPHTITGNAQAGNAQAGNRFRLIPGRIATHTQSSTTNNALLADLTPTNTLWLHPDRATPLGITEGDTVEVCASNGYTGQLAAHVTTGIHPEAVFVLHGFGHDFSQESRALGKGIADEAFMIGGLGKDDPLGGGLALQEHVVTVRKVLP